MIALPEIRFLTSAAVEIPDYKLQNNISHGELGHKEFIVSLPIQRTDLPSRCCDNTARWLLDSRVSCLGPSLSSVTLSLCNSGEVT